MSGPRIIHIGQPPVPVGPCFPVGEWVVFKTRRTEYAGCIYSPPSDPSRKITLYSPEGRPRGETSSARTTKASPVSIRDSVLEKDYDRLERVVRDTPECWLGELWIRSWGLMYMHMMLIDYTVMPKHKTLCRVLSVFVRAGMKVNDLGECGDTLLMNAARNRVHELCYLLVQNGADVNGLTPTSDYSALSLAVLNEDWQTARFLHDYGAVLAGPGQKWDASVFSSLIADQDLDNLDLLFDQFAALNKDVPWVDLIQQCFQAKAEKSALLIVRRGYFKSDRTGYQYYSTLKRAFAAGFKLLAFALIEQYPRVVVMAWSLPEISNVFEIHPKRYSDGDRKSLERHFERHKNRYVQLDLEGPQWEIDIYQTVHGTPASLQVICRKTILKHLHSLDQIMPRILGLPIPKLLKDFLMASVFQDEINLDPVTKAIATSEAFRIPPPPNGPVWNHPQRIRLYQTRSLPLHFLQPLQARDNYIVFMYRELYGSSGLENFMVHCLTQQQHITGPQGSTSTF